MKKVIIYSDQHAESIVSAAKVMIENAGAIAIVVTDVDKLAKELKGKKGENEVFLFVDEIDKRHLKADTVHYTPPHSKDEKKETPRRVVQMYGEETIPYVVNVIADHIHNQDPEIYKAAILADYSDLSNPHVIQAWRVLFSNNNAAIDALKAVGATIVRYLNATSVIEVKESVSVGEFEKMESNYKDALKKFKADSKSKIDELRRQLKEAKKKAKK
jgi:polyhydroxyalkanoate synthesis regulator phasin